MKRLGQFWVSKHLVETEGTEMAKVLAMLEFVPVRVNYFWEREAYQYLGHSPKFREITPNDQTPEYQIVVQGRFDEERKRMVPSYVEVVPQADIDAASRRLTEGWGNGNEEPAG